MARGDIGIGLLVAAADWHDYDILMQKKLDLLEDEMKKHRVVCPRLNGYNIFTKQRSLERTENMRFGSTIEFLDFALDKNVFEKKRVHRKKPLHGSNGDAGALTLRGPSLPKHQKHIRIYQANKRRFINK